ncbi:transmembrane anterior posterior transformation protein 1 [Galendromus occidentalis]|uniref:Transmembrane anterior posterior transformation protein 1 n=1 Tax=Galendromus occidentalis TaxID=34638 RepID=A0AAJ7SDC6_9ACAR|nr:transmembrane anterior posterior transformation protein 1 [Galendromus occidentalis]
MESRGEEGVRFRLNSSESDGRETKKEIPGDGQLSWDALDKGSSESSQSDDVENGSISFWEYLHGEFRRGYYLENDEQRYDDRREKFYMFFKIPKEFEKFQFYGLVQCIDAFLFVFTLLPVRFVFSTYAGLTNWIKVVFHKLTKHGSPVHNRRLQPAETCDFIKGLIIIIVAYLTTYIDTSVLYHMVKTQSVIKLYIFFNMLEVADRLFSNFGQDIIDALFWTATEPKVRQGERKIRFGLAFHFGLAVLYVFCHCFLVMLQAVALNVAINSQNKGLLAIMMSNNFVELKGMVFKKFEKNNLFQMSCSDVRERFHYMVLLFVVVLQTMKEYSWQPEPFWDLVPSCIWVMLSEILVDWVKHAFVTRFNEIHYSMYSEYITYLAYDVASSKLKNAYSDHSDLVARRMAFIPLPLGALVLRVVHGSVAIKGYASICLAIVFWLMLFSCKIVVNIFLLGRACVIIERHRQTLQEKRPAPRLCTSLPSSRRQSMEDLKPDLVKLEAKSEPQSANPSVSSSLADIRDQAELAQQSMNEAPIFAESAVDISTLGIKEEVLGEDVDQLKESLLEIKNRGRSISTGMLPGLPLQDKSEL